MGKRHKWADVIIAFAEGKKVQVRDSLRGYDWITWESEVCPGFYVHDEWRIKPEEIECLTGDSSGWRVEQMTDSGGVEEQVAAANSFFEKFVRAAEEK